MEMLGHLLNGEYQSFPRDHAASDIVHPNENPFVLGPPDPIATSRKKILEPGLILGSKGCGFIVSLCSWTTQTLSMAMSDDR